MLNFGLFVFLLIVLKFITFFLKENSKKLGDFVVADNLNNTNSNSANSSLNSITVQADNQDPSKLAANMAETKLT